MPPSALDLELSSADVAKLTSVDALAEFLTRIRYPTDARKPLTAEAIGLAGEAAAPIRSIELLAEDPEFLRVVFVHLRSLTAKTRNDLARVLGRTNVDHLLVLTSDFTTLEFVLLDKRRRDARGPSGGPRIQVVPLVFAVDRKDLSSKELRTVRRLTWTTRDGLEQFDKLRSVFESAAFSEDYFCNRGLFADHYLLTRLHDDSAWSDSPAQAFQQTKDRLRDAPTRWRDKDEKIVRQELYAPLLQMLGFKAKQNKDAGDDQTKPDYLLQDASGKTISAAFTYVWDRCLDGPDHEKDRSTPDENPGACVVTALEDGIADWIIVTNGRVWRLYSRHAHSRATNYYEVDLPEALLASGDTDPNEAFRYWWLFFRALAFQLDDGAPPKCWLDRVAEGSTEYAKELGERLKDRIFKTIFPHLARGFLQDRKQRLGNKRAPSDDDLRDVFEGTLTLLYRLLFLLYAESRDLLPVREAPYHAASLKKLKQEIAELAGVAESEAEARLSDKCSAKECNRYDRLQHLFGVMDLGDAALNVPTYNGGLFITDPDARGADDATQDRELRIARFLCEHRVPDRQLALAIDLLSRDEDPKTFALVAIDYKSLSVRHLGSIYEGLLEFKLKIADEDLTTQAEKGKEKYISLGAAKKKRGRGPEVVVSKGEVYLSNDKSERKASGSYYTPDPIVEYIVEHTVGPVLAEKIDALRPRFRKVRKTFDNEVQKATAYPVARPEGGHWEPREFALEKVYSAHKDLVDELFKFRTLDPAMGSGHFLVQAVDFITDRLLTFLNQFPVNPVTVMLGQTRRNILASLGEQGVQIDPAKLTDVNLLKRHVLKRCIYGVDLNPMAVELAKVSLWLDAFTLGAPLSFLNHHLRCGNALIGATMKNLRDALTPAGASPRGKAVQSSMFGLNMERMTEAIRQVVDINRRPDATVSEVKASASAYDAVRRNLDRYRIALDLLVAPHFGVPGGPKLLVGNAELDFESGTLATGKAAETIADVEAIATRPELRFFNWEIEFPEVFYDFAPGLTLQHVKHKDDIAAGTAGFDAVVGNPPYDELSEHAAGRELPEKQYLKDAPVYEDAQGGRLNVFRPFVLRAMAVLRSGGRHSFIVPMALLADTFTAALRQRLLSEGWLRSVAAFPQKDDPHTRVFFEAKLSTCVYVAEKYRGDGDIEIRTYPGNSFDESPRECRVTLADLRVLDPTGLSIPAVKQDDINRVRAVYSCRRVARFGEVAESYPGEIMFNASFEHCLRDKPPGDVVLRGAHIGRYSFNDDPKQGEPKYLVRSRYLADRRDGGKSTHHKRPRIAYQRGSAVDNWRRIIATVIPSGHFCSDTVGYFVESVYDLYATAACLNARASEWRFGLTSTNNHVNPYEVQRAADTSVRTSGRSAAAESRLEAMGESAGERSHSMGSSSAWGDD